MSVIHYLIHDGKSFSLFRGCRDCQKGCLTLFFHASLIVFLAALLFFSLFSCSVPKREIPKIDVKTISDLMPMLNKLEVQAQETFGTWQAMNAVGAIGEKENKEIVKHADIYFVLYNAAMAFLAEIPYPNTISGFNTERKIERYQSAIITAESELDRIDEIMKKGDVRKESWKRERGI